MNDTPAVNRNERASPGAPAGKMPSQRDDLTLIPPVDVVEENTGITLRADLPGVPKEKLKLHVEGDILAIEGEVSFAMPEGMEASYAEVNVPRFRRSFTLSKELDTSKITAEIKQGVLTLRIPKAEHAQPRRIEVNVA